MLSSPFHLRIPWFTSTQLRIIAQPSFRSASSSKTTLDPQTTRTCSRFLKVSQASHQPDCYPFVMCLRDTLLKTTQTIFDPIHKLHNKYFGTKARMPTFHFPQSIPSFTSTRLLPFRHVSSGHVPKDYSDNLRSDPQAQLRVHSVLVDTLITAGSATETLLRLLLPLSDEVH